jgi:hypothetical protein
VSESAARRRAGRLLLPGGDGLEDRTGEERVARLPSRDESALATARDAGLDHVARAQRRLDRFDRG